MLLIISITFYSYYHQITASNESEASVCWNADAMIKGIDLGQTNISSKDELNIISVADWWIIGHGIDANVNSKWRDQFDEKVQLNLAEH